AWMSNIGAKILNDVSYDYSVWVYQETGSDIKINITIKTDPEDYKSAKYQAVIPSGMWTLVTGTYTLASADGTANSLYIESDTNPVTFYFDDFKVIASN
ncbi:MAG: carbohydrate binding domain-containing protein, partial [Termitinemataceae bacterium]